MKKQKLKVKKLSPEAIVPKYAHGDDAGLDVYSVQNLILKPNHRTIVKTGISIELPKNHVALVWDKSGMASKGIKTMGGVIDSGYRGEYKIVLINLSSKDFEIKKGQKIAQILIQKVEKPQIEEVKKLKNSSRGGGGFGSTGK